MTLAVHPDRNSALRFGHTPLLHVFLSTRLGNYIDIEKNDY